jgi:UDP-2-acetamido-2,6-beta-L-arabino-hexul-4-ose reductase
MIKVGITGQEGFIGKHLFNYLGLMKDVELIIFKKNYFTNSDILKKFVNNCDIVVHLSAMNRHADPKIIYDNNIKLVKQLIYACESTNSTPYIIFSSSSQEESENLYGKSKYDGRKLFEEWSIKNNAKFTGLIIPNVFGPFGNPFYNSFIATFAHQLTHGELPTIDNDKKVKLIYVGELVIKIYNDIITKYSQSEKSKLIEEIKINHTAEIKVSKVLNLLYSFKENYFEKGIIPDLNDTFEKNLFNTFLCYIDHASFFPFYLKKNSDNRGSFVEILKLNSGGQVSFSTTASGVTRGNHFHTSKAERFIVIKGKAEIVIRKIGTKETHTFLMDGANPSFVDMPIWYTHNIRNVGDEELYTVFWINEMFNPDIPDTYYEEV